MVDIVLLRLYILISDHKIIYEKCGMITVL